MRQLLFIVVVILGHNLDNSQVNVYRTVGPTLVSKSKNMSVGKVCIKHFEFAYMTILSPETVSIVFSFFLYILPLALMGILRQCSIIDMQVPPFQSSPKTAEILAQNASKMH